MDLVFAVRASPPQRRGATGFDTAWPQASWVLAYFAGYLIYLFRRPESELLHWVTLVLLPALGLWGLRRRTGRSLRFREVLRRIGLTWPQGGRGLGLALMLVVLAQGVQLMNADQRAVLQRALGSSDAIWIVPSAFLLMLLTAAFTEEFFFRGIFQRAIASRTRSHLVAIASATVAFSLYHVPYAYLNPNWPSAGDLPHAISLAFTNGVMGGVVLGLLFVRSRGSLIPPIIVHAAVNWIPAIRLLSEQLRFGDGG